MGCYDNFDSLSPRWAFASVYLDSLHPGCRTLDFLGIIPLVSGWKEERAHLEPSRRKLLLSNFFHVYIKVGHMRQWQIGEEAKVGNDKKEPRFNFRRIDSGQSIVDGSCAPLFLLPRFPTGAPQTTWHGRAIGGKPGGILNPVVNPRGEF